MGWGTLKPQALIVIDLLGATGARGPPQSPINLCGAREAGPTWVASKDQSKPALEGENAQVPEPANQRARPRRPGPTSSLRLRRPRLPRTRSSPLRPPMAASESHSPHVLQRANPSQGLCDWAASWAASPNATPRMSAQGKVGTETLSSPSPVSGRNPPSRHVSGPSGATPCFCLPP